MEERGSDPKPTPLGRFRTRQQGQGDSGNNRTQAARSAPPKVAQIHQAGGRQMPEHGSKDSWQVKQTKSKSKRKPNNFSRRAEERLVRMLGYYPGAHKAGPEEKQLESDPQLLSIKFHWRGLTVTIWVEESSTESNGQGKLPKIVKLFGTVKPSRGLPLADQKNYADQWLLHLAERMTLQPQTQVRDSFRYLWSPCEGSGSKLEFVIQGEHLERMWERSFSDEPLVVKLPNLN